MQSFSKVLNFSGLTLAALVAMASPALTATTQTLPVDAQESTNVRLAQFQDARPRITVLPLDHGDIRSREWWWRNYDAGQGAALGITELLIDELVNEGSYALMDSSQFVTEDGDVVEQSEVLEQAKENDVDAVLIGTITQFDLKDSNQCVNVPFRGRVCRSETKATVKLNVRLVDPISKTVLATARGKGDASSSGFDLDFYSRIPDLDSEEQRAADELLSEATEKAIQQMVPNLAEAQDKF